MASLTRCGVCLENFEKEGAKLPKMLPCSHTFCSACLQQLRSLSRLPACPECRQVTYRGIFGENSPVNRYVIQILEYEEELKKKERRLEESKEQVRELREILKYKTEVPLPCTEHDRPHVVFCLRRECQKLLCPSCPLGKHLEHNLVALNEHLKDSDEIKEMMKDAIDQTNTWLLEYIREILSGRKERSLKTDKTLKTLDEEKVEQQQKQAVDKEASDLLENDSQQNLEAASEKL